MLWSVVGWLWCCVGGGLDVVLCGLVGWWVGGLVGRVCDGRVDGRASGECVDGNVWWVGRCVVWLFWVGGVCVGWCGAWFVRGFGWCVAGGRVMRGGGGGGVCPWCGGRVACVWCGVWSGLVMSRECGVDGRVVCVWGMGWCVMYVGWGGVCCVW